MGSKKLENEIQKNKNMSWGMKEISSSFLFPFPELFATHLVENHVA